MYLFLRISGNNIKDKFTAGWAGLKICLIKCPVTNRSNLIHSSAKVLIWIFVNKTRKTDTDLGRVIASKDRPVLYQGYLTTQSGSGKSCWTAGHSSAYNHKVERTSIICLFTLKCELSSEFINLFIISRRDVINIRRKNYSITPAVKSRKIMKRDISTSFIKLNRPSWLPAPFFTFSTKYSIEGLPINYKPEFSGGSISPPWCNPVMSPDPDKVFAIRRYI